MPIDVVLQHAREHGPVHAPPRAEAFELDVVGLHDRRTDSVVWAGSKDAPALDHGLREVARTGASLREPSGMVVTAIQLGGTPIGAPIVGWVADAYGPRWAIMVAAATALVAFAIGAVWWARQRRADRMTRTGTLTLVTPTEELQTTKA